MLVIDARRLLVTFMIITVTLSFLPSVMATEEKPLVALLNERIQTQDSIVLLEKVIIYPNESSIYGPGEINYGMPVKEEYRKGPVVTLSIEREPSHPSDVSFAHDWLKVDLFSHGRRLQKSSSGPWGSKRMVFGFSLWAEADMSVSSERYIELENLGELSLNVSVSEITKVLDLPFQDTPRGKGPFWEDDDVQIWEVKWEEGWSESRKESFTSLRVRFNIKTAPTYCFLEFIGKNGARLGASTTENWTRHVKSVAKNRLDRVEFWKVVLLAERAIPSIKFVQEKRTEIDRH